MRATVRELAVEIDRARMPTTLGAFVAHLASVLARDCEEPLTSVGLEVTRARAFVDVRFSTGRGANPDDYEHTDLRWTLVLAPHGSRARSITCATRARWRRFASRRPSAATDPYSGAAAGTVT